MPRSPSLTAVAVLCAGVFVFALQDVIIKGVSGVYPVHEAIAIRCLTALPILLAMVHFRGGLARLISAQSGWLALRGGVMMVSYTCYYLSFPIMPLAKVVALFFTAPLFVTALAGPLLGERIGLRRWAATVIGFAGVVVIQRPGLDVFDIASLLPIVAALAYAAAQLMARRFGATESAPVMSFFQNVVYFLGAMAMAVAFRGFDPHGAGSLAFLLRDWSMPTTTDLLLLGLCGPIAAVGMMLLTEAYRMSEVNFVTPFEYTGLIWATLWGFTVFGEVPAWTTLIGAVLIVGAGLYVLFGAKAPDIHAELT